MAIGNLLKPKTQQEIDDLEKRGFRKNSGKWRFNINITSFISAYDEDEDTEAFKNSMIACLETKTDDLAMFLDQDDVMKFEDIIDEFRSLDKDPEVDEIDYAMSMLYDWADDVDVWVESFF